MSNDAQAEATAVAAVSAPTIEEQLSKVAAEKAAVAAQISEVESVLLSLGHESVETAPDFIRKQYETLSASLEKLTKAEARIQNDVPAGMALEYLNQLDLSAFGMTDETNFTVTFDPATGKTTVVKGGKKRAASAGSGSPKGEGKGAVKRRGVIINGVSYASAAAGLDAVKTQLGLRADYGAGNSAVRVLKQLAKTHEGVTVEFVDEPTEA